MEDERRTLGEVLLHNARAYPYDEAATDGTLRVTWQELCQRAESACVQFRNLGIQPGDRVAVVLPNQLETLVLYWACALWGAVFVGANPRLGHDDLERIIKHSGATLAFLAESVDAASVPKSVRRVIVSPADPANFFSQTATILEDDLPPVNEGDVFAVVYTSGTTGPAKGAILTHRNLMWCAAATGAELEVTKADTLLVSVAITHIFGLSAAVLVAAQQGARCVLMREHAAGRALDLCEWEGVTIHHGSPTMFMLEIAAQRRAPRDLSKLRTGIIAAAPVGGDLAESIRNELHCDVQIAWGLTETSPTVTMTRSSDPPEQRRLTVGRPIPGAEVLVRDIGGEFGEVLVSSPGVFSGYYKDADTSAAAFTEDGYFRTGDLGWLDEGGYLHLAGRIKDIIIRDAMHVYPDELERVIASLPWVDAVSVVGVPDAVLGERICACVVEKTHDETPADIVAAVRHAISGRLAAYKVPDFVLRTPQLPRSVGGKVLKGILREDAMAQLTTK